MCSFLGKVQRYRGVIFIHIECGHFKVCLCDLAGIPLYVGCQGGGGGIVLERILAMGDSGSESINLSGGECFDIEFLGVARWVTFREWLAAAFPRGFGSENYSVIRVTIQELYSMKKTRPLKRFLLWM